MTTIDASPLAEALQSLIDARLDTIDRMLVGRVNRQDRLSIVREVESQVFDLLQGRDPGSLERDDVLAVLARLDPPEAYLPEEGTTTEARPHRPPAGPRPAPLSTPGQSGRIHLASGILGMVSVGLLVFFVMLAFTMAGANPGLAEILIFYVATPLSFVTGLLAVVFAARARLQGPWAFVGLVNGIESLLVCVFLIQLMTQR